VAGGLVALTGLLASIALDDSGDWDTTVVVLIWPVFLGVIKLLEVFF